MLCVQTKPMWSQVSIFKPTYPLPGGAVWTGSPSPPSPWILLSALPGGFQNVPRPAERHNHSSMGLPNIPAASQSAWVCLNDFSYGHIFEHLHSQWKWRTLSTWPQCLQLHLGSGQSHLRGESWRTPWQLVEHTFSSWQLCPSLQLRWHDHKVDHWSCSVLVNKLWHISPATKHQIFRSLIPNYTPPSLSVEWWHLHVPLLLSRRSGTLINRKPRINQPFYKLCHDLALLCSRTLLKLCQLTWKCCDGTHATLHFHCIEVWPLVYTGWN